MGKAGCVTGHCVADFVNLQSNLSHAFFELRNFFNR